MRITYYLHLHITNFVTTKTKTQIKCTDIIQMYNKLCSIYTLCLFNVKFQIKLTSVRYLIYEYEFFWILHNIYTRVHVHNL